MLPMDGVFPTQVVPEPELLTRGVVGHTVILNLNRPMLIPSFTRPYLGLPVF